MEYTYEDWLKMVPEPNNGLDNFKTSIDLIELRKINEAKKYTFDTSFKLTFEQLKVNFLNDVEGYDLKDRIEISKNNIEQSKKAISDFKYIDLIKQNHSSKYIGISGFHYKVTKEQEEGKHSGIYGTYLNKLNDFHYAVIQYNLLKKYEEYLNEISPDELSIINTNPSYASKNLRVNETIEKETGKGEIASVRYLLINHFFEENPTFKSLSFGTQEKLLGYILGVGERTAKGIKNEEPKYLKAEHKVRFEDLLIKIKKGDIL